MTFRRAGHVDGKWERRNAFRVLVVKSLGKVILGRPKGNTRE
jgi:hypothetical protein